MNDRISRGRAVLLGLVTLAVLALGGLGLAALAAKDRLWSESYEILLELPDAGDVPPGTPVRIRGVQAGQVVRIDDPASDSEASLVQARVRLDSRYRGRVFRDATARVQPVGMLGAKAIAIHPGTPASGPLADRPIVAQPAPDLAAVADKLADLADEADALLKQARNGDGTLAKMLHDDTLYRELTAAAGQTAAAASRLEGEAANVRGFVSDGRETLYSIRQSTDALARLPLVRGYVEDAAAMLVRPECRREAYTYNPNDLFEPGTAILHDVGRGHLANLSAMLRADSAKFDIVVAALADPNDAGLTSRGANELTRKQAEAVMACLSDNGAHKTGFFSRNHGLACLGLGTGPHPLVEQLPAARVTVYVFK